MNREKSGRKRINTPTSFMTPEFGQLRRALMSTKSSDFPCDALDAPEYTMSWLLAILWASTLSIIGFRLVHSILIGIVIFFVSLSIIYKLKMKYIKTSLYKRLEIKPEDDPFITLIDVLQLKPHS